MERLFEKKLLDWKQSGMKKPLMVVGARQIGKTYIIEKFAKENFEQYLYFNLEKNSELREIFEKTIDDEKIIENLELYIGKKIDIEKTILFFDEVQVSENFIVSLKYFNESDKQYKIIYTVCDKSGNSTVAERIVNIVNPVKKHDKSKNGYVYLTFDDGPTFDITPKILDILKEENIKATFFVINYTKDKEPLIKRIVEEGHSIGIHGNSKLLFFLDILLKHHSSIEFLDHQYPNPYIP